MSENYNVPRTLKLPAVELRGIFSVEYDFILSSLANPAAVLYASIKDKAATALAKYFQSVWHRHLSQYHSRVPRIVIPTYLAHCHARVFVSGIQNENSTWIPDKLVLVKTGMHSGMTCWEHSAMTRYGIAS